MKKRIISFLLALAMAISLLPGTAFAASLMGDADGSGEVDYVDAMIVLQYHTGVIGDNALDLSVCDVDGSGEVDYVDAMMILQYHTGVLPELHEHEWIEATCETAKTCKSCGTTEGSAAGHSWSNATCTTPKTCSKCGATEGSTAGHSWKEATCTEPKTCSKCNVTEGSAAGHNWKDATCTAPKTCTNCDVTEGNTSGHNYISGVCSCCGAKDSNYIQTLSVGETWVVDGQWEFTVNSVTTHYLCNSITNKSEGYEHEQVVIIDYTYKNLGYTGTFQDLYLNCMSFDVYDESGEAASMYACIHTKDAKVCIVGTKCTAQEDYVLYNNGSQITLVVSHYTSNGNGKAVARFNLNIN